MTGNHHSKSGLFLMELLINLLLFCLLCGCGMLFFIKSHNLTAKTTALQNAVSITSTIAGIYETGDGSFSTLMSVYPQADYKQNTLSIYFDENFNTCQSNRAMYRIDTCQQDTAENNISISVFDNAENLLYEITTRQYSPTTLGMAKEVAHQ